MPSTSFVQVIDNDIRSRGDNPKIVKISQKGQVTIPVTMKITGGVQHYTDITVWLRLW